MLVGSGGLAGGLAGGFAGVRTTRLSCGAGACRGVAGAAGAGSAIARLTQARLGEQVPHGNEHGGNHRPNHKAVQAEQRHAAQRGDEDHIVGHLRGPLPTRNRAQQVVHHADDEHAGRDEDGGLDEARPSPGKYSATGPPGPAPRPTAGSSDRKAISVPQSTGAWTPRNQKISPPSATCSMATTTLPLTVARTTVRNLPSRSRLISSSSGHGLQDAGVTVRSRRGSGRTSGTASRRKLMTKVKGVSGRS